MPHCQLFYIAVCDSQENAECVTDKCRGDNVLVYLTSVRLHILANLSKNFFWLLFIFIVSFIELL